MLFLGRKKQRPLSAVQFISSAMAVKRVVSVLLHRNIGWCQIVPVYFYFRNIYSWGQFILNLTLNVTLKLLKPQLYQEKESERVPKSSWIDSQPIMKPPSLEAEKKKRDSWEITLTMIAWLQAVAVPVFFAVSLWNVMQGYSRRGLWFARRVVSERKKKTIGLLEGLKKFYRWTHWLSWRWSLNLRMRPSPPPPPQTMKAWRSDLIKSL